MAPDFYTHNILRGTYYYWHAKARKSLVNADTNMLQDIVSVSSNVTSNVAPLEVTKAEPNHPIATNSSSVHLT